MAIAHGLGRTRDLDLDSAAKATPGMAHGVSFPSDVISTDSLDKNEQCVPIARKCRLTRSAYSSEINSDIVPQE
jgi:hypothetical protein